MTMLVSVVEEAKEVVEVDTAEEVREATAIITVAEEFTAASTEAEEVAKDIIECHNNPYQGNQQHTQSYFQQQMKAVIVTDCLNMYTDLNKSFTIVCDASDYQLGSCILQDGRPVAYRKNPSRQHKRTTQQLKKSY